MVFQASRQPVALQQANLRILQGSQRPSDLDNAQATVHRRWDDANPNLYSIPYFTTSGAPSAAVRRFGGKTQEGGVGHGQDAWVVLREKFGGCSREALRVAHPNMETMNPDDFLYKNRCRDRLNSVTPMKDLSDRRYEDIILQCLTLEYDRVHQISFEREGCNLADIRRMMSKIYADNIVRSNSDSSRGITGRGVAMQATGRNFSHIFCHYCNKCGHYKKYCAEFKVVHQHNQRRRRRQQKKRGGHQSHQPKPGQQQQQQRGGGQMWCSCSKTTTHNDADFRARSANGLHGKGHFAHVRPPSFPEICSSWDLPGRDDSDEKLCISISAREVQPATKHTRARVEKKNGAWPFGPVLTAATEGWSTRARQFTPRTEPGISSGEPVAEEKSNFCYTFGMVNDEKSVEKTLMASSSVAVKPKDSVNSNLVTLLVDSGASGYYFDYAVIHDIKHRLQDYVHLYTPRKVLTAGGAMLKGATGGELQDLVTDENGNQNLVGSISGWCPGLSTTVYR